MQTDSGAMAIGEVAARAAVRVSAIRYYEKVGLVPRARRVAGRRVYDSSVFESLALIRLAQDAGFSIAEVRRLIDGFERHTPAPARWQALAARKLKELDTRIERAQAMKTMVERLVRCRCETLDQCARRRLNRATQPG